VRIIAISKRFIRQHSAGLQAQNPEMKYPDHLASSQCKTYDAPREHLGGELWDLASRCWALL